MSQTFSKKKKSYTVIPHCRWMSVVHGCPPSVIRSSDLPCYCCPYLELNSLPQHVTSTPSICPFSKVASRFPLQSSGVPFH